MIETLELIQWKRWNKGVDILLLITIMDELSQFS